VLWVGGIASIPFHPENGEIYFPFILIEVERAGNGDVLWGRCKTRVKALRYVICFLLPILSSSFIVL
jgi:hypothetical protein